MSSADMLGCAANILSLSRSSAQPLTRLKSYFYIDMGGCGVCQLVSNVDWTKRRDGYNGCDEIPDRCEKDRCYVVIE